jgi:hypothetical protein
MIELTSINYREVNGGSRSTAALRFIAAGARFGGPVGFGIGIGIELYLQLR